MITEMESPYIVFYISLMVVIFCSGVILGAYLSSRREEKMLKYFRDEVLTKEQNNFYSELKTFFADKIA